MWYDVKAMLKRNEYQINVDVYAKHKGRSKKQLLH